MSQYHNNRRSRKAPEQSVVENILTGLWYLISLPFKQGKKEKTGRGLLSSAIAQQLGSHWPSIEGYLENASTWGLAVSEGDKLLDAALQALGIVGTNMGERLKSATAYFPANLYQEIWQAHKLRNSLAHEVGVQLSLQDASQAVRTFRNALIHLGVFV